MAERGRLRGPPPLSRVFIDTNVFVYADDADSPGKRAIARPIVREHLAAGTGVVSTQVLTEYFSVATRKLSIPPESAHRRVQLMTNFSVVVPTSELVLSAIELHRLSSISIWDTLIVRAAASARCTHLLTEDLSDGALVAGVRIENPFRDTPAP